MTLVIFAWVSYIIICIASCIIIYEFLEERFPFIRKRGGEHDEHER